MVGLGRLELQTSSMSTKNMPFFEFSKLAVNGGKDRRSKGLESFSFYQLLLVFYRFFDLFSVTLQNLLQNF